ncbi:HAD family hydrolase [Acuticoccus sediminis]|uniref:HAD family hydrolase n=1 Tax=Acuticoccus sediminis TaxID=2184697 RepID=A0A8B2P031_9HYPH|nr:HAD family hydrolase [Acuticoccus sediminis]RAI04330.1 HAD family hydrolase [Acuticoccus sediminis]
MRLIAIVLAVVLPGMALADPLPSWNDTDAKAKIIAFVDSVTDPAADTYVTPADRVAVFDNDGTLWAEKPMYVQAFFALDRLKAMAEKDPSVLSSDVLKAAAEGDMKTVAASGEKGLLEIIDTTHTGLPVETFIEDARTWLATAKNPAKDKRFEDMVYQPMLELLSYLRDQGFSTYIVSGGGIDFIRAFSEKAYNIPVNQVIGSSVKSKFEMVDGVPTVIKEPGVFFVDDKAGKPVGISGRIGKRPIFAAGNSDGDFEMLQWTTAGEGPRFGLIVHHTDAEREFAYDRDSNVGKLVRGLDEGPGLGWLIVDMAKDWAAVWPDE